MQKKLPRLLFLFCAMICFFAAGRMMPGIIYSRDTAQLTGRSARKGIPGKNVLLKSSLGGARGILMTAFWIRAQEMKNNGQFHEMIQLYEMITDLEPNFAAAWAFIAWDLAFNVSVEYEINPEDRIFWVFRGIDMLRKEAIPLNPRLPDLYYELAWIFHFKVGQDTDFAHQWYRAELNNQMNYALDGISAEAWHLFGQMAALPREEAIMRATPGFIDAEKLLREKINNNRFTLGKDRLVMTREQAEALFKEEPWLREILFKADLFRIANNLREIACFEPAELQRLCSKYGPIEWRQPASHALYWATRARDVWLDANKKEWTLKYERIIYFALIKMVERGKLVTAPDGTVYGVPDYRFLDAVITHMDETLPFYKQTETEENSAVSIVGAVSGYRYFLVASVFQAYFENRRDQANRLLDRLNALMKEFHPEEGHTYDKPLDQFVEDHISEFFDSMNKDRTIAMINMRLMRELWYLSIGDNTNATRERMWARLGHRYAEQRWPAEPRQSEKDQDFSRHVPSVEVLRIGAVINTLFTEQPLGSGMAFTDNLRASLANYLQRNEPVFWNKVYNEYQRLVNQAQREQLMLEESKQFQR